MSKNTAHDHARPNRGGVNVDQSLAELIEREDFSSLHGVDEKQVFFNDVLNAAMDGHAPSQIITPYKEVCPWITDDIKNCIRDWNSAYRAWRREGSTALYDRYKELRNHSTALNRETRYRYNTQKL